MSGLDAPATVAAGAAVDVVVTVDVGGCITYDHIAELRGGTQINLAAWGREATIPSNTACPDILIREPRTYRLEPPFPPRFTIVIQPIGFEVLLEREVVVQ